jgi:glycosyltransferase involved in cell wall biosynthesis
MKIVISKGQFLGPISGADEILVNYATMLHKFGHDVSVLLIYPCSSGDQYYRRLREAGVSIYTVAPSSVGTLLNGGRRLARELLNAVPRSQSFVRRNAQRVAANLASRYQNQCRDFLKQFSADVVHVLSPDPGAMIAISAAHAAGIPVIYQEVGIPYHPPNFEFFYKQFTAVLPLCAEVTTLSPRLAQVCRETLPFSNNLSVLPITVEDLRNGHASPRAEQTDITIGFAGRIEHLKGPLVLLKAFAAASRACPRLKLIIAGSGTLEQQFIALSHQFGVASRCEFVSVYKTPDERQSFMEQLDIFALPSLTEGTPNSIIEAMSQGLPIVASDVGGIPDLVASDAGILVPPKDSDALSRALVRLAQDPELRRRMGNAARDRYEKLFSPEAVLPVLLKTYRRVSGKEVSGSSLDPKNLALHPWEQTGLPPFRLLEKY